MKLKGPQNEDLIIMEKIEAVQTYPTKEGIVIQGYNQARIISLSEKKIIQGTNKSSLSKGATFFY